MVSAQELQPRAREISNLQIADLDKCYFGHPIRNEFSLHFSSLFARTMIFTLVALATFRSHSSHHNCLETHHMCFDSHR